MARSKFSKMLEKINNNEEVINSKDVEENNITVNQNTDVEDNGITEEEMKAYLEDCGGDYFGNDEVDDNGDNKSYEYNLNSDEFVTIDDGCNETNNIDGDDGLILDDVKLNDNELNENAESSNSSKEDNSENESENKSEDELEDKSKNKPNSKQGSKTKKNSILYDMLSRPEGATLDELEIELGWKRPSIRGVMSNMQKEFEFCLLTIDVSKPSFNKEDGSKTFKKETRYFIKDCEFDLNDTIIALFKIDGAFSKKDNN